MACRQAERVRGITEVRRQLGGRHGPRPEVPLTDVAAHPAEEIGLSTRLDTLGDDHDVKRMREADHARDDRVVLAVQAEPVHETIDRS